MLKHFTLIFSLSMSLGYSQTLTYTNNAPQPGDSYDVIDLDFPATSFNAGQSGIGITWDFSGLTTLPTARAISFNSYTTAPCGPSCFNNVPINVYFDDIEPNDSNYYFYNANASKLDYAGSYNFNVSEQAVNEFTNPKTLIPYPFSYGSTYVDSFYNSGQGQLICPEEGRVIGFADGQGTLMLPGISIPNVLRIKHIEEYFSVCTLNPRDTSFYADTVYSWYIEGTHLPLLYYKAATEIGSGNVNKTAYYQQNLTVSIKDNDLNNNVVIYPNPTKDNLVISYDFNENLKSVKIINTLGAEVLNVALFNENAKKFEVNNLSRLRRGVYLVKVEIGSKIITKKLVLK